MQAKTSIFSGLILSVIFLQALLPELLLQKALGQERQAIPQQSRRQEPLSDEARARLNYYKRIKHRNKENRGGIYRNASMGFMTSIPSDWKISELGQFMMKASMKSSDNFILFSAELNEVAESMTLDYFYQQSSSHFPPSWKISKQERTELDGVPAIAIEISESKSPQNMYRQKIFALRHQRMYIFDILCPEPDKLKNGPSIRAIWSNLRFSG